MPSSQIYTWNPLSDYTLQEIVWLSASVVATGLLFSTLIDNHALQRQYDAQIGNYDALASKYDDHERMFKDHQLLSDFYESALGARTEFMPYVKILEQEFRRRGKGKAAMGPSCV